MQGKLEEAIASWRRAIACYRQAGEDNPKLAPACNGLAWLLATADDSQLRNPGEAVQLARTAVQLEPNSWEYWDTLSVAAYRAGDWKTSLDARQEKLQRHPIATDDRLFLAMTHWQLGDKAAARQSYDEAITEIANDNVGKRLDKQPAAGGGTTAGDYHVTESTRRRRAEGGGAAAVEKFFCSDQRTCLACKTPSLWGGSSRRLGEGELG